MERKEEKMYDVIIVGSGPAGLSAAIYGKRAGLHLLVLEKSTMSGGQVLTTYEVDNYLGLPGMNGFDMGMKFREHADKLNISFQECIVNQITEEENCKIVSTNKGNYQAKALIWAAGANHAYLGVPGEKEWTGKGVSYCATCDGAFFRGKKTAVVGGGDVALEDAIFLSRICEKVYLIHRRGEFRGARILQEKVFSLSNIEVCYNQIVTEIHGSEVVESVMLQNVQTKEEQELFISGVFIAVGIRPNTEQICSLVSCNKEGYILAGEDCITDREGIFAAGDVRTKPLRQIVTAVADGANAIASVNRYLSVKNI